MIAAVPVFLSCSFRSEDASVIDLVRALCSGLNFQCINVSAGFSSVPPDKARELIGDSVGLIAVATRRDRLDNGEYAMPAAVREEISIGFGLEKPILILAEEGVRCDGFMNNYGTRLAFDRETITTPQLLERLVFSLATFKDDTLTASDPARHYATGYYSEITKNLLALEAGTDGLVWVRSVSKRLHFQEPLTRDVVTAVWPSVRVNVPEGAGDATWSARIISASRPFDLQPQVRSITPDSVGLALHFLPEPQIGDFIEFERTVRSPYLYPLYADDVRNISAPVSIGGRDFHVFAGLVPVERTVELQTHFMFPASYGLTAEDLTVLVASHSFSIDYLTPWELNRVESRVQDFGAYLLADVRVREPLPRHLYGIAWNPPRRPAAA